MGMVMVVGTAQWQGDATEAPPSACTCGAMWLVTVGMHCSDWDCLAGLQPTAACTASPCPADPDLYCYDERSVGGAIRPHHPPHRHAAELLSCAGSAWAVLAHPGCCAAVPRWSAVQTLLSIIPPAIPTGA